LVIEPPVNHRIVQEEVFGPVITINSFETEEEAVQLAHATHYDLAAGLWTNDLTRAHRVIKRLRVGSVWVNTFGRTFNDAPFGGFGASGHGRDLGLEAMTQYVHAKNVCISLDPGSDEWFPRAN
jgi:betaine-aldehyde dehydrogenase